jgi:hypothetical protein
MTHISDLSATIGLSPRLLSTKALNPFKVLLHGFERFRGVSLPILDLARDP